MLMSGFPITNPKSVKSRPVRQVLGAAQFHIGWYDALSLHRLLFPGLVFTIHLAIVQFTASMAFRFGTESMVYSLEQGRYRLLPVADGYWQSIVTPLSRWNSLWYIWSSQRGYEYSNSKPLERFAGADDVFWPLLPWAMRTGHTVSRLPHGAFGYLFANVCLVAALIVLYRLIEIDFGLAIARRSLWCLALFPTAFF